MLRDEWYCPPLISRGKIIDTTILPGFLFIEDKKIKGIITYNIIGEECEIVTLNSFEENKGIGTALINGVLDIAKKNNCNRVWMITTNDDVNAIRFYQKKGFDLKAAHINAMEISRKLKPSIPLIGMDNIPIKHELEFEILLK
jgi:GNAT superfamily N-acetyltransferase